MKPSLLIIFILLLQGCKQKDTTLLDFEQKVLNEVFYQIVNATYRDKRLYTFYCKGGDMIIKNDKFIGYDKLSCEKAYKAMAKDSFDLVIAIDDKVTMSSMNNLYGIPKEYKVLDTSS